MSKPSNGRYHHGFYIVAACFLILFMLWGMVLNTFPIFLKPMTENMNWGRGALSVALLMGALGSAVTAPIAGRLIDRLGARPVMMTGALMIGVALLAGSNIANLWQLYVVFTLIGCGLMCATIIPCSLLISNWFVSRRGAAMGVAFVGTSVGGMLMAPVANWIIQNHGWRTAFTFSGVSILVLVVPVIFFAIRTRPSDIGLEPYRTSGSAPPAVEDGWAVSVRDALSLPVFWQIALIMLIVGLVTGGLGNHCVAYLTDLKHSPTSAAFAWSMVMAAMAVGKLLLGPIADRFGPRRAMVGSCILFSVSIVVLIFAQPYWVVLLFAAVYGFACGAPLVLSPLLTGQYLGTKNFGAMYGALTVLATVGGALGPVGAGLFFDSQKTYLPVFYSFMGLMWVAAAVSMLIRPVRQGVEPEPREAPLEMGARRV